MPRARIYSDEEQAARAKEAQKRWQLKNKDRLREYAHQYVENNREKVRDHAMRYYWRHRDEIIVTRREECYRKKL
jgi:predicted solute-binding protein